jgi:hypothetical protein
MTPRVEILSIEGCPNGEPTRQLVEQIAHELRLRAQIELIEVADADAAVRVRFLGSPTVRVDGRDVEPGAGTGTDFTFSCRVYRGRTGLAGKPDEQWIRDALVEAASLGSRVKDP